MIMTKDFYPYPGDIIVCANGSTFECVDGEDYPQIDVNPDMAIYGVSDGTGCPMMCWRYRDGTSIYSDYNIHHIQKKNRAVEESVSDESGFHPNPGDIIVCRNGRRFVCVDIVDYPYSNIVEAAIVGTDYPTTEKSRFFTWIDHTGTRVESSGFDIKYITQEELDMTLQDLVEGMKALESIGSYSESPKMDILRWVSAGLDIQLWDDFDSTWCDISDEELLYHLKYDVIDIDRFRPKSNTREVDIKVTMPIAMVTAPDMHTVYWTINPGSLSANTRMIEEHTWMFTLADSRRFNAHMCFFTQDDAQLALDAFFKLFAEK